MFNSRNDISVELREEVANGHFIKTISIGCIVTGASIAGMALPGWDIRALTGGCLGIYIGSMLLAKCARAKRCFDGN